MSTGGTLSAVDGGAGPDDRPLVSIIIVLFNSAEHISRCVSSIASLNYRPIELVFVDNGSRDASPLLARKCAAEAGLKCLVSETGRNSGFARANNLGFSLSHGQVLLMLNPDTELWPDALEKLVAALDDRTVGIAGCKVLYPDRVTIQHAGGYIRDNGLTMHYGVGEADDGQYDTPWECAYVTGAALAIRRNVLVRAGMLDPGYYPAYFEETDLCLRIRRLGYRVVYIPGARVVHDESTTVGKFTKRYYYLYHRNRIRFMLKNYSWRFLLERALPMEERWLTMIEPWEQAVPLNHGYFINILNLPLTLAARWKMERELKAPRLEDTVSEL